MGLMAFRIDIHKKVADTRATGYQRRLKVWGLKPSQKIWLVDSFVIDAQLSAAEQKKVAAALTDGEVEEYSFGAWSPQDFSVAIEVGFLPGVTDNLASTAKEAIEDLLGKKFAHDEAVYTARVFFISGVLSPTVVRAITDSLYNPLIERGTVYTKAQFKKHNGFGTAVPKVVLQPGRAITNVNLELSDTELATLGKLGIPNKDGTRRGPLALDLPYLKAIRAYFRKKNRQPTDIELETLAQTWSEHCKHTIMASPLDDIREGLFKGRIQAATKEIRKQKGKKDFCVSVFKDNSGAIVFDDTYLVTHKVETHNSPSALDPFGGAITGIVGVNRDALGFGLGAKPIANTYGFCLADPSDTRTLYRDKERKQKMLSSRRIMDGVIEGVRAGGNESGIPTPHGFLYFDPRYRGKPLVFAGTIGLIPRRRGSRLLHEKAARPGDYIVMLGGRVGQDGIHGATFSSEAIDTGSPATAVQIGDPITQKKFSDALVREARDLGLYNSLTDNGAGGLSSSVGEMAKESGGCLVELEKVPLKYPGLEPWKIWISESQERMTLAVPKRKWKAFSALMKKRGVEATVIGTFTATERCVVTYRKKTILDIDLDFLHDGNPTRHLVSHASTEPTASLKHLPESTRLVKDLIEIMGRPTIASHAFVAQQYDHEVQGTSVLKPLVGRGRVDGDAAVLRPLPTSRRGVVVSSGLVPTYSDTDAYAMAASAIDTAIRSAIVAGGSLEHLALLDNICWCSPLEPQKLFELKRAMQAAYDYAVAYGTPYVSGKDSMYNDFKGWDDKGPVSISIPPTLLITALGVLTDIQTTLSPDVKRAGDSIYLLGSTNAELRGSEYLGMLSAQRKVEGGAVPRVSARDNKKHYKAFEKANKKGLVASAISVSRGGLAVALFKALLAGGFGADISLERISGNAKGLTEKLFSESQGRILATVAPSDEKAFEAAVKGLSYKKIGTVTKEKQVKIAGGHTAVTIPLTNIAKSYHGTFKNF